MRLVINVRDLRPGRVGGLETAFREVFDRILRWQLPDLDVSIEVIEADQRRITLRWRGGSKIARRGDPGSSYSSL